MADQFIQGQAGQGDGAAWSLEIARCKAVINRLDRRLGQATEAHAQARSALHNADQKHARAAIAILADEAEGLANDLANCEARSPMLCCSLDVLSRLWLAGAGNGPPRFGPAAVAALQAPPRLASIDLPPPEVQEVTKALADHWRAKYAALLTEVPAEAEAAA